MAAGLKVTYRKSAIGSRQSQRATLRSLGLRRLGQSRTVPDTPVFRGMIARIRHLVAVEPVALGPGEELRPGEPAGGEASPRSAAEQAGEQG